MFIFNGFILNTTPRFREMSSAQLTLLHLMENGRLSNSWFLRLSVIDCGVQQLFTVFPSRDLLWPEWSHSKQLRSPAPAAGGCSRRHRAAWSWHTRMHKDRDRDVEWRPTCPKLTTFQDISLFQRWQVSLLLWLNQFSASSSCNR